MMKSMMKRTMTLLLIFALSIGFSVLPAYAEGHPADGYIARAQEKGWLAQAGISPDFPAEGGITYESLIIMVCEALGIKPWYSIDYFLNYTYEKYSSRVPESANSYKAFADARNTRMNETEHLRVATQFGLLVLSDYLEHPDGGYVKDHSDTYPERLLEPYRAALRGGRGDADYARLGSCEPCRKARYTACPVFGLGRGSRLGKGLGWRAF